MSIDIRLTPTGDLPQQEAFITGAELVVQNVLFRLRTFEGEDPEDIRRGLPWERWNQTKATALLFSEMEDQIGAEILDTPGVLSINSLVASYSNAARAVVVNASIVVEDDALDEAEATLTFSPEDPINVAYRISR